MNFHEMWSPTYGYTHLRQLSNGQWACIHERLYNTIILVGLGDGGYSDQY